MMGKMGELVIVAYPEAPEELLETTKSASVFFSESYYRYLAMCGDTMLLAYDGVRVMPIRCRARFLFRYAILLSEPFKYSDDESDSNTSLEIFLERTCSRLLSDYGIQWCSSTASGLFEDTPCMCKRIPFGSHVVDLTLSEDDLWGNVHSKHKNVIRKAKKTGVVIKSGGLDLLDDYMEIEKQTSARTGRRDDGREYYAKQLAGMGESISIYIAYYEGVPQAGAVLYFNHYSCYYMYGATATNAITGAANYLLWNAMIDMKSMEVNAFSFVGCRINEDPSSKYHGIQRFKERFGGKLIRGYRFRKELKPFWYHFYCLAVQIASRSANRYKDPIDQELYKWGDIQK